MELPKECEAVQKRLIECGINSAIKVTDETTHTAADAAKALGVEIGQIAKTLVFMAEDKPYVVVMSGDKRVSLEKFGDVVEKKLRKAKAEEVREYTGYVIGGVAPVMRSNKVVTLFVDESLKRFNTLWVAAGTSVTVFSCSPDELARLANGKWVYVAE